MKGITSILLALAFMMGALGRGMAQCPMCKAAVESNHGDGPNPLAEGLNTGILYLFVLPYIAIMILVFVGFMSYRKKKKARLTAV